MRNPLNEARIDWRVLAFTGIISVTTGMLFGLAPAIGISRANLRETLNVRGGRRVLRNAQIVAEIALAFVLLVGAGLLMRSFQAIRAVDLGFRTEHILSANFALPPTHYSNPQQYLRFLGDVLERVRALPGVLSATATQGVPMRGSAGGSFQVFGRPVDAHERLDAAIDPGIRVPHAGDDPGRVHFTPRDEEECHVWSRKETAVQFMRAGPIR